MSRTNYKNVMQFNLFVYYFSNLKGLMMDSLYNFIEKYPLHFAANTVWTVGRKPKLILLT